MIDDRRPVVRTSEQEARPSTPFRFLLVEQGDRHDRWREFSLNNSAGVNSPGPCFFGKRLWRSHRGGGRCDVLGGAGRQGNRRRNPARRASGPCASRAARARGVWWTPFYLPTEPSRGAREESVSRARAWRSPFERQSPACHRPESHRDELTGTPIHISANTSDGSPLPTGRIVLRQQPIGHERRQDHGGMEGGVLPARIQPFSTNLPARSAIPQTDVVTAPTTRGRPFHDPRATRNVFPMFDADSRPDSDLFRTSLS